MREFKRGTLKSGRGPVLVCDARPRTGSGKEILSR